jgi:hypothetical protein
VSFIAFLSDNTDLCDSLHLSFQISVLIFIHFFDCLTMTKPSTLSRLLFTPQDVTIPSHRLFEGKSLDANVLMYMLNTWYNESKDDASPMSFMLMDARIAWTCLSSFVPRQWITAKQVARYTGEVVPYRQVPADADRTALFAAWRARLTPYLFVGDGVRSLIREGYTVHTFPAIRKLLTDDAISAVDGYLPPLVLQPTWLISYLSEMPYLEDLTITWLHPVTASSVDFRILTRMLRLCLHAIADCAPRHFAIYAPSQLLHLELNFRSSSWGQWAAFNYPQGLKTLTLRGGASKLLWRAHVVVRLPRLLEELYVEFGPEECEAIQRGLQVVLVSSPHLRRLCISHAFCHVPVIDGNFLPENLEELVVMRRPYCLVGSPNQNDSACEVCKVSHSDYNPHRRRR